MRKKKLSIILLLLIIPMGVFAINNNDTCLSTKKVSRCEFSSFKHEPESTVFFYCKTKKSTAVEMYSSDALIRGFKGSIKTGTGRLSISGKNDMKMLNTHFFRVLLSPISGNGPNVRIYSDHDITCQIGKGIWRSEMAGNLD